MQTYRHGDDLMICHRANCNALVQLGLYRAYYIPKIGNVIAHESTKNELSNYNKTKLNKNVCTFYSFVAFTSKDSIKRQRPSSLAWCYLVEPTKASQ